MRATLRKDTLEPWLRPGVFLYWQGQRLRLLPGDRSDLLRLQVEDLLTQEQRTLRIEELLLPQGDDPAPPIFALTLEGLQAEIERQHPPPAPLHAEGLPKQLLQRAEAMIAVVETVERVVAAEAERAALKGKPHRRTPAIRRACAQLAEPVTAGDYIQIELALAEE